MTEQVSWLLVEKGWTVVSCDGQSAGRVEEVLGDASLDIFNGFAIVTGFLGRPRYVPAERVKSITPGQVELDLTEDEVDRLEPHEG